MHASAFVPRRASARAILFLILGLSALSAYALELKGSAVKDGKLVIPKAGLSSTARFFSFTLDGVRMEVFALKASDGSIRTAFNTCQVCYDSGRGFYLQSGNQMVCQNCGNRFPIDKIEQVKNGCNPIPITKELKSEDQASITIPAKVLAQAKDYFARWKE